MTQGSDIERKDTGYHSTQLALWMREQARWVSLLQLMSKFGLSRAQVYLHLASLRKNVPDCMEKSVSKRGH